MSTPSSNELQDRSPGIASSGRAEMKGARNASAVFKCVAFDGPSVSCGPGMTSVALTPLSHLIVDGKESPEAMGRMWMALPVKKREVDDIRSSSSEGDFRSTPETPFRTFSRDGVGGSDTEEQGRMREAGRRPISLRAHESGTITFWAPWSSQAQGRLKYVVEEDVPVRVLRVRIVWFVQGE
ncbi:uncharacterized protein STEHIDRAFT_162682 [Stereum hirsutum FP-91666 SS1]|uniref:uncharacterized protein n=1 Tax=Stereum hirsutum (strain FP-91666) TaxID=721885 RepID=UPI000444978A|nr:uncharacterized protein STEHIDRAFT_162682 [Stereum hirsutum FP-91666 SS1]EIM80924.1 hypothetical protein STEHIDRAFT_162682 [Stereum hirsutum FP-91666 SS1]